jgi:hypothetical protein
MAAYSLNLGARRKWRALFGKPSRGGFSLGRRSGGRASNFAKVRSGETQNWNGLTETDILPSGACSTLKSTCL